MTSHHHGRQQDSERKGNGYPPIAAIESRPPGSNMFDPGVSVGGPNDAFSDQRRFRQKIE
jgi:hypothetical protein